MEGIFSFLFGSGVCPSVVLRVLLSLVQKLFFQDKVMMITDETKDSERGDAPMRMMTLK